MSLTAPPHGWFYKENIAAFLSWLVFAYIQQHAAIDDFGLWSWQSAVTALCMVVFVVLFFSCQRQQQHAAPWTSLSIMWLAMTCTAFIVPSGFAPGLGVLWVCLLPWFVPSRWLYWTLVAALGPVVIAMALDGLTAPEIMMLLVCGSFQFFAIFAMSKAHEEKMARDSLAIAHQQLLQAQTQLAQQAADAERVRIARDLHDSLGHHLTGLVIQLQVATYQANPELKPVLDGCQQQAKQLLHDIRHTVSQLRQPHHPNLAMQLRALQQSMPDVQLHLQIPAELALPPFQCAVLFRVCQEAITNSRRHAQARHVWIDVWQHHQQLCLRYVDDGCTATWPLVEGNGLQGMRERVEEAGGRLFFSKPNGALQIDVTLPSDGGDA